MRKTTKLVRIATVILILSMLFVIPLFNVVKAYTTNYEAMYLQTGLTNVRDAKSDIKYDAVSSISPPVTGAAWISFAVANSTDGKMVEGGIIRETDNWGHMYSFAYVSWKDSFTSNGYQEFTSPSISGSTTYTVEISTWSSSGGYDIWTVTIGGVKESTSQAIRMSSGWRADKISNTLESTFDIPSLGSGTRVSTYSSIQYYDTSWHSASITFDRNDFSHLYTTKDSANSWHITSN